jgi:ribonuclease VapC
MIIDTSAILAILFGEPDAEIYAEAIAGAEARLISAANYLEAAITVDNQAGLAAGRQFDAFVEEAGLQIEPTTEAHASIARRAYLDYGKGNHPAKLNFGDCFAYALAKATGRPLLYKGADFSKTDVQSAL